MRQTPLSIMIIADDPLARAGLVALLENEDGLSISGSFGPEEVSDQLLGTYRPDVILWDVGWESGSQEGAFRMDWSENAEGNGPPVVALISDESQALYAWSTGVQGLLDRNTDAAEIVLALRSAIRGLMVMDSRYGAQLLPAIEGSTDYPVEPLTARELEVLQLLAEGLSNKALALRLEVSEHTVKFHVNAIFRKLGVQSRTQAVVRATRLGLILL